MKQAVDKELVAARTQLEQAEQGHKLQVGVKEQLI